MKVIMNVTLPAVVVTAFASFEREFSLLFLILLGLGGAIGPYFLMYALTRKMKKENRVYCMICVSGFNVGCYGLPIINAFYGQLGTIVCAMFDIGNCVMMTSGNYAFTTALLHTEGENVQIRGRDIVKRFFSSVPIDTYLIMLALALCGLHLPQTVVDFINPIASANAFLSMFMLGLLFTLPRQPADWKNTLQVLAFRFAIMTTLAVVMFHVLPFSTEIRQIVVLALLCPIGAMSPGFIEKCHGDGELAAFTNSISTLASLVVMTALTGIWGVG